MNFWEKTLGEKNLLSIQYENFTENFKDEVKKLLEKKGILLRSLEAYRLKNKLRLTIGNTRENILLLKTLGKIFKK